MYTVAVGISQVMVAAIVVLAIKGLPMATFNVNVSADVIDPNDGKLSLRERWGRQMRP
jgi:hypothetical protein